MQQIHFLTFNNIEIIFEKLIIWTILILNIMENIINALHNHG